MEYTINQLAQLAGISTRTLRYYDDIGLLVPQGRTQAGYRLYTTRQVDLLQHIMFYKHMGMPLEEIKTIVNSPGYDKLKAMEKHLSQLYEKQKNLNLMIENVENTIGYMKGEKAMADKDKFEIFKQNLVEENEEKYGREIRKKYGDKTIDESNEKLFAMSQSRWNDIERLNEELNKTLKLAVETGDPASEIAQKACELHKRWIGFYWNFYSEEAHLSLCEMYTQDERFKAYYENIAPDCAEFLLQAMKIYFA